MLVHYMKGWLAGMMTFPFNDNPHEAGEPAYEAWARGWLEGWLAAIKYCPSVEDPE